MARTVLGEADGIVLYSGFEGASVGALREIRDGIFHVDCLEEPNVPEMAFHGVFYDYNFALGVRNTTDEAADAHIRLHLCERSAARNMKFMCGAYWVKEGRCWRHLPAANHNHGDGWVDTVLTLAAGQDTVLSTKPQWTSAETEQTVKQYAARLPFASVRSLGTTAEGRDLWVVETEPRDQRIFIHSSFQSAEFAGDTVLHVLDWLGTPTKRSQELLEHFQFTILPVPMPDGVAHGYSIMNARGRCPMFDFGLARRGQNCAEESLHTWNDMAAHPPAVMLDVHVHPGRVDSPKLNPVKGQWYLNEECAQRAEAVAQAMLACCPQWRVVPVPENTPEFDMTESELVLAAKHLGSTAMCIQDYALTAEGTKPLLITLLDAALGAI